MYGFGAGLFQRTNWVRGRMSLRPGEAPAYADCLRPSKVKGNLLSA